MFILCEQTWLLCLFSSCPVDIIFHLIGEVRKNVLTPASLDACAVAAAPLVSGERDNAAGAKPATTVTSTEV